MEKKTDLPIPPTLNNSFIMRCSCAKTLRFFQDDHLANRLMSEIPLTPEEEKEILDKVADIEKYIRTV